MYGTFTLTGRNTTPSGRVHTGQVIVTANAVIRDTAGNVVMSGSEAVTLDGTGAWSLVLPCDSPELNPSTGIGYRVGYELRAATMTSQSFYATADMAGSTLDVSKIVSVSLPTPLSAIVGPAGDDAYEVAVANGYTGSRTDWLASLVGKPGAANSLAIGSVTTAPAGSSASASISGATPNQTLSLTIPKGDPGDSKFAFDTDGTPYYGATATPSSRVATEARAFSTQGGARLVPWGDSTTAANSLRYPATSWGVRDFWAWGQVISGGAFQYIQNAGLAGDDSGEGLLRFQADVAAYAPNIVPIVFGINDAVSGLTLAQFRTNITEMVRLVRSIGAAPWLGTVSGNMNTGLVQQRIAAYNAWIRQYAASQGIPLLDIASIMTDPATGKIPTAFDLDGTHQNAAGAKAIGQAVASLVAANMTRWSPPLPVSNTTDSQNLIPNGLFLTGTPTPTSWANTGGTPSIVTGDSAILGNWARLADGVVGTGNIRYNWPNAASFNAGDVVRFCGRLRNVMGTTVGTVSLYLMLFATSGNRQIQVLSALDRDADGAFCVDAVVPTGASAPQIQLARTVTTVGSGYTQIAQVGLYNLTTLGIS